MQILLVADLHYALPQFDWLTSVAADFDAVVLAGDLLESASHVPIDAQILVINAYLEKLSARSRLFVCSGNHDLTATCDRSGERVADWLLKRRDGEFACDGDSRVLGTMLVSVLPWWDGPATRDGVTDQLSRDTEYPKQSWLWAYHAPPADCSVSWAGSRHYGDTALLDWIEAFRPDYVLCGHVHQAPFVPDGSWVHKLGSAWVFNAGQQPGATPAHVILDLDQATALWFSIYGNEIVALDGENAAPAPLDTLPDWFRAAGPAVA